MYKDRSLILLKIILIIFIDQNIYALNQFDLLKLKYHDSLLDNFDIQFDNDYVDSYFFHDSDHYSGNDTLLFRSLFSTHLGLKTPIHRASLFFQGRFSKFHFFINPIIINEKYRDYIGTKYGRDGISARFENAFLKYSYESLSIQLGRSPVRWGQSFSSSIIQSGLSPGYDHASLSIGIKNIKYDLISGQLSSGKDNNNARVRRFIAGKKFSWIPSKKFLIGWGDQILYTGVSRGIELSYINPFIPYFLSGLEDEEEESITDNDNSMIFFFGRYLFSENLSFYSELIIDDLQIDKTNRPNKIGFKFGLERKINIMGKYLTFFADYTYIDPDTYLHPGQYTNWNDLGYNLGYPFGPGSKNISFQFMYHYTNDFKIFLEYNYLKKNKQITEDGQGEDKSENGEQTYYNININKKLNNFYFELGVRSLHPPFGFETAPFLDELQSELFFSMILYLDYILD